MKIFAVVILALVVSACSKQTSQQATDTTTHVGTTADADAITRIASDKELLRQSLLEASDRGTLTEAVTAAAADSATAAKIRAGLSRPSVTNTASRAHTTGKATSSAQKKDALDRANESLDRANQTVEKSGQVLNKAQDVGKKAGDILNGRR